MFNEINREDFNVIKSIYEQYGRTKAVRYTKNYCTQNNPHLARQIVDKLQKENNWQSWNEESRKTRRKRKFVERATRLIQGMGGTVEGVDVEKLRAQEVVQVKEFLRKNLDKVELADLSNIIKTFAQR